MIDQTPDVYGSEIRLLIFGFFQETADQALQSGLCQCADPECVFMGPDEDNVSVLICRDDRFASVVRMFIRINKAGGEQQEQ